LRGQHEKGKGVGAVVSGEIAQKKFVE